MAWLTGYPREQINWHPTIETEKCLKCGMCMNCGKSVYDWTKDGARVARPHACIVANLCMGKAISFPDIESIREIYRREGIWAKVKKQMREERKLKTEMSGSE